MSGRKPCGKPPSRHLGALLISTCHGSQCSSTGGQDGRLLIPMSVPIPFIPPLASRERREKWRTRSKRCYGTVTGCLIRVREAIKLELGDVLWYVAQLATELGDLEEVAVANLGKLSSRASRGRISGSGDSADHHRAGIAFLCTLVLLLTIGPGIASALDLLSPMWCCSHASAMTPDDSPILQPWASVATYSPETSPMPVAARLWTPTSTPEF